MTNINEEIKLLEEQIKSFKKIKNCNHKFYISAGDNISTTGPTGLYKYCKHCDYCELVGHVGSRRNVIYKNEEKKDRETLKKAKRLGLTNAEINRLKDLG